MAKRPSTMARRRSPRRPRRTDRREGPLAQVRRRQFDDDPSDQPRSTFETSKLGRAFGAAGEVRRDHLGRGRISGHQPVETARLGGRQF
jgi:hypothetical protein